jgi:hypothetical protein
MCAEKFLADRSISVQVLDEWADEALVGRPENSEQTEEWAETTKEVVALAIDMLEAGLALPPKTAQQ